jgi:hypothetical protein
MVMTSFCVCVCVCVSIVSVEPATFHTLLMQAMQILYALTNILQWPFLPLLVRGKTVLSNIARNVCMYENEFCKFMIITWHAKHVRRVLRTIMKRVLLRKCLEDNY